MENYQVLSFSRYQNDYTYGKVYQLKIDLFNKNLLTTCQNAKQHIQHWQSDKD